MKIYDVLIVDGNGIAHRAHAVMELRNTKGEPTSVAFGVLNMLRSIIERFEVKDICVCWDWKGSKKKKEMYPDYKKTRHEHRESLPPEYFIEMENQINDLIEILPYFGIKQIRREHVEADDLMGLLCYGFVKSRKKILILSSDQDLFQLISSDVDVYYPPKDLLLTKENFEETLGIKPNDYLFYRTLKGDTSDNIKGLKGFGEVTSKKLILKFGGWTDWFDEDRQVRDDVVESVNKAQKEILKSEGALDTLLMNYQLMSVGWLDSELQEEVMTDFDKQKPVFNDEKIKEYFLEKNFDSYLQRYRGWTHPFRRLFHAPKIENLGFED